MYTLLFCSFIFLKFTGVGDLVIMDQFVDRTTKRQQTYYDGTENGLPGICHIAMHTPFCEETRKVCADVPEGEGNSHGKVV